MLLEGKVAIVTGGASQKGIGWATAKLFADQGAKVAILDLDHMTVNEAAAKIGAGHRGYVCDVRRPQACDEAVAQILKDFGQVDILFNNAGVSQPLRLMDSTQDDYDLVLDVSLRGAYNLSRSVVPHMRQRKSGAIICTGSVAGLRGGGVLGGPHYAAAKGGVHSLSKAMARELGPDGIRVNAIAPGLIDTELLTGRMTDERKADIAADTPLCRVGDASDVAKVCLFLASDLASYVTGSVIDINGGYHIH